MRVPGVIVFRAPRPRPGLEDRRPRSNGGCPPPSGAMV